MKNKSMKFNKERVIALLFCLCLIVVGFQNCAGEEPQTLPSTHPNSDQTEFLSKLNSDFQSLNLNNKCSFLANDCQSEDLQCIQNNVREYYGSLECLGFTVVEADNCLLAVSKTDASHEEIVDIDATCFYESDSISKSLHLDACFGDPVPFKDHPSTGTVITAWKDFGNKYPYSRVTKSLRYYEPSNPKEALLRIAHKSDKGSEIVVDACGKEQQLNWLSLELKINLL